MFLYRGSEALIVFGQRDVPVGDCVPSTDVLTVGRIICVTLRCQEYFFVQDGRQRGRHGEAVDRYWFHSFALSSNVVPGGPWVTSMTCRSPPTVMTIEYAF